MKFYYCPTCSEATARIYADAEIKVKNIYFIMSAQDIKDQKRDIYGEDIGEMQIDLGSLSNLRCAECENAVELVEESLCPHDWDERTLVGYRWCRICGARQEGKYSLVWVGDQ